MNELKLKCNVCTESPTVLLTEPTSEDKIALCPCCGKQLAYSSKNPLTKELNWYSIDTDYDKEWGGHPVSIVKYGQTVKPEIINSY